MAKVAVRTGNAAGKLASRPFRRTHSSDCLGITSFALGFSVLGLWAPEPRPGAHVPSLIYGNFQLNVPPATAPAAALPFNEKWVESILVVTQVPLAAALPEMITDWPFAGTVEALITIGVVFDAPMIV